MVSLWNETKCLLCDLVKGECLWPREVVGLPDVRGRVLKYRGRDAGNVGSREGGDPSVCCGATKYTVAPNHGDKEVKRSGFGAGFLVRVRGSDYGKKVFEGAA